MQAFDAFEDGAGGAYICHGWFMPKIDHGVFSADDSFHYWFVLCHKFIECRTDEADMSSELGPVIFAESVAQDMYIPAGWELIAGERGEQRGFAASVGAKYDPMLSMLHPPVEVV
jgi:hypothetical protein